MPTTGGALAFAGLMPPYEATITRQLREAGAVIIAKTQMTELANWVTVGMPGNYNSLTGYGFNPYDPRRDPRHPTADGRPALGTGGSSSGVGTPRASGQPISVLKHPARSSILQTRRCSSVSSRRWGE